METENHDQEEFAGWNDESDEFNIEELAEILDNPLPKNAFETLRTNEQNIGFDNNVGHSWLYPSNLGLRSYQYNITKVALFQNTLVVLPTGLGKTFIAAVVMYNIYRYYPTGKVIFMAPTRPLVTQQIEACQKIMPFPLKDTIELTGKLSREKRLERWRDKRVFFTTPQALQADMMNQNEGLSDFPYEQIKLIVVDEAHKAKGRYAYVEVTQMLHQRNKHFRVLALSATPGRSIDDVAEVVKNLFISRLEVRWDTSIDVLPYVHNRTIKTIVVSLGEEIKRLRQQLIDIIDPYLRQLIEDDVVKSSHTTRNALVMEQKRFLERLQIQNHPHSSAIKSNFSICISLFYALELLECHGLRVFLNNFEADEADHTKYILNMIPKLQEIVTNLSEKLGPDPFNVSAQVMTNGCIAEIPKDLDFGHPKFEEARKCILEHFEQNPDSRVIVFCEYRYSVMLIYRLLLQHTPMLKPKCFVGQGGTGALRALSQKQQIQIMNDFRSGKNNILIATSIGEEGIDVGEVELIVCFDIASKNPTRFIQRIGRTGRKKEGKVIMLVSEGREQQTLKGVKANKDETNKKLANSSRSFVMKSALYKHSPRMIPTEFNPECVMIHVRPRSPVNKKDPIKRSKMETFKANTKKSTKIKEKLIDNTQDLRKFFKKPELKLDEEDLNVFESQALANSAPKTEITQNSMERVKRIFKNLEPSTSTNTQLLEISTSQQSKSPRLDTKEIKKLNKLLKSSLDFSPLPEKLLPILKCMNFTKDSKLLLLQERHVQVREICEQMDVLKALEQDENDMSTHEIEIRETFNLILDLFDDRNALKRFLEDAELDALAAKKHEKKKIFYDDEFDMTNESFEKAFKQVFVGLDLYEGNDFDNFEYRQEELKKTKAYQCMLAAKNKENKNSTKNYVYNSMVFDAVPFENTTNHFNDDFINDDDENNMNSYLTEGDSKYCSQWEEDFKPNRVNTKSTPIAGAIVKAFERQKDKQIQARKRLETLNESKVETKFVDDDDDDIIFMNEEINKICDNNSSKNNFNNNKEHTENNVTKIDDLLRPPKIIEASFMQCQQSTPISAKIPASTKTVSSKTTAKSQLNIEPSLQYELEINFEDFLEPLPEELALLKDKTNQSIESSLKENSKPSNDNSNNSKKPAVSLFEMLENKPVNSVMTPKRSFTNYANMINSPQTTPKNTSQTVTKNSQKTTPQITPKLLPQLLNASDNTSSVSPKIEHKASPTTIESPKCRLSTSQLTKQTNITTSPSILSTYAKGIERLKSIGKIKNFNSNLPLTDIDSPIRRKPNQNAANLKRKIIDSDTETDETPTLSGQSKNSDDDFEAIEPSPQLKRRRLSQKRKKPLRPARLCSFFNDEAEKSGGSGHSDEEDHDNSYGSFVCDTIAVENEEEEAENEVSATQMQAIYLQSVKSPHQRRGGFKIPEPRKFNTNVYSQPVEPSQSFYDSFVVHEDNETIDKFENKTLCPLEEAERILKERKREAKRRKLAGVETGDPVKKRARKCYQLEDSSDDEGGGGVKNRSSI